MKETKAQAQERAETITKLREWLPPGSTIYTVLRHVSRSGMQREISLYAMLDGHPQWLDGYASKVLRVRRGKNDGLIAGGCGMDMGFHLAYELSHYLYPEGFGCIGDNRAHPSKACPASDHSNGDRDYTPHVECLAETRETHDFYRETGRKCKRPACHWHASGGYALRHSWM